MDDWWIKPIIQYMHQMKMYIKPTKYAIFKMNQDMVPHNEQRKFTTTRGWWHRSNNNNTTYVTLNEKDYTESFIT